MIQILLSVSELKITSPSIQQEHWGEYLWYVTYKPDKVEQKPAQLYIQENLKHGWKRHYYKIRDSLEGSLKG